MPATLATLSTDQLVTLKVDLIMSLRILVSLVQAKSDDPRVVEAARNIRTINNLLDARGVLTSGH